MAVTFSQYEAGERPGWSAEAEAGDFVYVSTVRSAPLVWMVVTDGRVNISVSLVGTPADDDWIDHAKNPLRDPGGGDFDRWPPAWYRFEAASGGFELSVLSDRAGIAMSDTAPA